MPDIHPSAIIDRSARIAEDAAIGPFAIIGADAVIGAGCMIAPHATIGPRTVLGIGVRVHHYASIGTVSQDLKHSGETSSVIVGDGAIIREYASVNRGTREGGVTRIGRNAVLMAYSHTAHECVVGEEAILVNGATLGGECVIGRRAIVGGLVGVHQFCHIGTLAIVGACSKVTQDIPPFVMADGHPARPYGPNRIGLERAGFDGDSLELVRRIYRELMGRNRSLEDGIAAVERACPGEALAAEVLDFCRRSKRGIARPRAGESSVLEVLEEESEVW
jgi:UDP-N-acetylglucosamine acyltransferase